MTMLCGSYTFLLLCSCVSFISSQTEDFGFEQEVVSTQPLTSLRRLWGMPDVISQVGKYVRITIPADAFEGEVNNYEASGIGGKPLPEWLRLDTTTGTLEGVPGEEDMGEVYIMMVAVGPQRQYTAKDYFAIEVLPYSYTHQALVKERCSPNEDITTLTVVIDKDYSSLSTDKKISLLTNLARYLGMSYEKLSLIPQSTEDMLTDSALMAGPGNVKRKSSDQSSVVQWQVGCGGKVMPKYSAQLTQVKHDSYDGSLAEVIQQPVVGWHLTISSSNPPFRHRRQIVGSGDSENDTDDLEPIDEDLGLSENGVEEEVPESRVIPIAASPVFSEPSTTVPPDVHPHRHHHGEAAVSVEPTYTSLLTSPAPLATIMPTPTYDPERPAVFPTLLVTSSQDFEEFSVAPTPVISQVEPSVTPEMSTPQETDPLVVESSSEHGSTEALTTSPPPTESTTKQPVENSPPVINHKLPRQAITAGKPFRYVIPETVFSDAEDGNTRRLHLTFKTKEGTPLESQPSTYSWIHFNPENQEVIALPLEEQVSRWEFTLEARDREGLVVNDTLDLTVQHHKGRRTVTHALTLDLALQSTPTPVEWQLTLVERLAALYNDPDTSNIIVLGVTPQDDPITFTWTNDSLPRSHCPREQIDNLLKTLRANEDGKPTDPVRSLLSPQITVVRVSWVAKGTCSESSPPPDSLPPTSQNFPPIPRNQVDILNATLGELLVYTVPEDTFYDPEDGSTRNMKMSLLNMDRSPLSPTHWLQFDIKNQEFYGIPMAEADIGKKEYQLVCKDSGGLTAYDGLIVLVHPAAKTLYNVEFSMTLDIDHDTFANNPAMKRHFVERLAELFGDRNTSSIVLSGVSANPTVIVWHNQSLPTDYCPDDQIKQLRQILLADNDRVSVQVNTVLGPEFPVTHATLVPTARCVGALTPSHPLEPVYAGGDVRPVSPNHEEYLVTVVVPAVVIAGMLLCAGLVACALYRRRRTGKMSVGSEDERQSFRSKGIPVIFQDELEERPEPANKSPVIMKEEKPPLPPPEYHQRTALLSDTDHHEDSPYQPPPPFASSRDSARPKPTPTYRMPPPK